MRAFEVYLNKKRLCVAGIGESGALLGVIQYIVNQSRNEVRFEVSGFTLSTQEHVTWDRRVLEVEDEVRIKIIEATAADRPATKISRPVECIREDPKEEIRNQKRYVRQMARKFGWKVTVVRQGP